MRLRPVSILCLAVCMLMAVDGVAGKHKNHPPAHKNANLPRKAKEAKKAPPPPAPVEKVEEVEAVEAVEATPEGGKAADGGGEEAPGFLEVLSRLHPAVVHLPIAWVMLLFLTDVGAFVLGRREVLTAGLYLSVLAFLSFFPSALTGLLRLDHLPQDATAIAPALVHRNIMYLCCVLSGAMAGLRIWKKNEIEGNLRWVYMAMVSATFLLVAWGAHLGGRLVYGDDFLPF